MTKKSDLAFVASKPDVEFRAFQQKVPHRSRGFAFSVSSRNKYKIITIASLKKEFNRYRCGGSSP